MRDYGTAEWDGGDAGCDHRAPSRFDYAVNPGLGPTGVQTQASNVGSNGTVQFRSTCGKCGATRVDSQIGLEPTLADYIASLVAVFREVRRVLRPDGTCWVNLGDSYAGSWGAQGHRETPATISRNQIRNHPKKASQTGVVRDTGLKPKDLMMVPARVAIALQEDGWYLRSDIIWAKPNPMPESVTDRPTSAHEHVFLLSKGPRYFYDAAAIAEPSVSESDSGNGYNRPEQLSRGGRGQPEQWTKAENPTRNRRNVWTVSTTPYAGAHFATFPPKLIEPMILAGCPKDGTVLDPFLGSGTTLLVADRLSRNGIGIELNPTYAEMARQRISGDCPMFAQTEVA